MSPRVLIGPSAFARLDPAPRQLLRDEGFEIVDNPFGRKLQADELQALLPDIEGLIAGLEPLARPLLEGSRLRVISRCGAGLANVDLEAARELGIAVRNTPDAPTDAVAELTVGALLALLRRLPTMSEAMHGGHWNRELGESARDQTVAIVGLGRIGRRVAELLSPFGPKLLAVDPIARVPAWLEATDLEDALRRATVVTIHAAGERPLLGSREFGWLAPGAILLNGARGELVDERALRKALDEKIVRAAWLDVFHDEPYSGPLCAYPQVLLTPHAASFTATCRRRMEMEAAQNLIAAFREAAG